MMRQLIDSFRQPSAEELAQREIEECKRDLLRAGRMRDYYTLVADFNKLRIKTLNEVLYGAPQDPGN